jgi:hypothetical protein
MLLESSPNIPRVHYHTINARDECFYFFYNISRRYYMVNNFTQKINFGILVTCTRWRHAHAFTVTWIFNFQASKNNTKFWERFDAKVWEELFKMLWEKPPSDTQTDLQTDLPWRTLTRTFRRVAQFYLKLLYFLPYSENISSSFYQKHWRYFLNHLCSVFVAFFYVFGIPVSFSSFFSTILHAFFLFETKTDSTNAKQINFYTVFTRRTIDNIALFLWSIPSCFLINFVF